MNTHNGGAASISVPSHAISSAPQGAIDVFAPTDRFTSARALYGRLHRWWLLLRKYWWLTPVVFIVVLGPAFWLTVMFGPSFESKSHLWVPGKIAVSENWSYTEELVNFLGTQVALLQSPEIQNRAMARMQIESKSGGISPEEMQQKISDAQAATDSSQPIPYRVKAIEGAKSSTLEVSVVGPDPGSTRKFLNCLLAEYLNFKRDSREQASTQAASSLAAEAAQLKNDLAVAQKKLEEFQASNNVVMLQQQGNGDENYLGTLNRQLAVLKTEQRLLDSLQPEQWMQADVARPDGEGTPQTTGSSSLTESQGVLFRADQQMHLLVAQRDELSRFLRPEHPKIIHLNQEIAEQEQIAKVAKDEAAKQLALRKQALDAQVQNLGLTFKESESKAIQTGAKMAEYQQLQQNGQRLQAAYDKTLDLMQNLNVANHAEQESMGILDPASIAKPTHRLYINLGIGTVVAVMLNFGLLYCLAFFRDDFASRTELAEQLSEPVLGQIPAIRLASSKKPLQMTGPNSEQFEFLEAFRNLRASLLLANGNGTRSKTIAITSSLPGEGKSTVALYLAATLANGNARVLLVDGDLRRPNLHQYFGLPNSAGLAELLNGEQSTVQLTYPAGGKNLAFLSAGEAKRNPGDLMLSPSWDSFLSVVSPQFDFIIVDTPPAAVTDDAATLAPKLDGVLFVVRALATSARVANGALEGIRQRNARVMGLVFNHAVSSFCEKHYYKAYADEYAWKEQDEIRLSPQS